MKKTLLITVICGMMVTGTAFSQHTQSLHFTLPEGGYTIRMMHSSLILI
jgi:hypothetical protein